MRAPWRRDLEQSAIFDEASDMIQVSIVPTKARERGCQAVV